MIAEYKQIINCSDCLFKWFVCQYISKEDFAGLYKTSTQAKFHKGEYLIKQGLETPHLIFLAKGKVKFNHLTESGKNVIDRKSTRLNSSHRL